MARGLSPLQTEIMTVLRQWPSAGQATPGWIGNWARPGDIIERLALPPTNVVRASVSRALRRLCERRLVVRASGEICSVGKSYRYLRF
jgi:DNA-binding MarR family transcriptional regulator